MENPKIIDGGKHSDERGSLFYNNDFGLQNIKRIYCIENADIEFIRGWTGHRIEERWFAVMYGSFILRLVKIDDWENPAEESEILEFRMDADNLNILHMPKGYASAIQAREKNSKLLVMVDHSLGEIDDDYRFPINYFKKLLR
ncbi:WxcM-like domain-containing protein [Chryseobacterium sp. JK1]|uniref:WxcM-like domain-containing protein n=1 Tax=Chryseobacterium sp. JK1 TaxID=874294 RepID=UPI003D69521B